MTSYLRLDLHLILCLDNPGLSSLKLRRDQLNFRNLIKWSHLFLKRGVNKGNGPPNPDPIKNKISQKLLKLDEQVFRTWPINFYIRKLFVLSHLWVRLRFLKHHNNCCNDLYNVFFVCYKTVTTDRNGLRTKKNLKLTASKSLICFVIWTSSKWFKFDYFDMEFL